jgi:aspartoacylase
MIKKIAIIGGTHGNELTGIKLIEHYQDNPDRTTRSSFATHLCIGNPLAVHQKVRYVEDDLNRAFSYQELEKTPGKSLESQRAHELNQLLGPKMKDPKMDFILDLHTTTADMGITLIVYEKKFNLRMAAYIQSKMDNVHIFTSDKKYEDTIGLQSIAPHSMLVEIGPVAQGLLRHDVYDKMHSVCSHALDYVQKHNSEDYSFHGKIEAYQRGTLVYYPVDGNNRITAMIHKDFQAQNYKILKPGAPVFYAFGGKTILYDGSETGYPVFTNEAAYLEKNVAFRLNKKVTITV